MKLLVIGKFYLDSYAMHVAETLQGMAHDVRRFEPGFRPANVSGALRRRLDQVRGVVHAASDHVPSIRAGRMKRLWRLIDEQPPEVVIVCHDFLWPAEVKELKRRCGARVALWYPDSLANFGRAFFMTAPYDALFFKDPYIVHAMDAVLESPVYYLPECFNPVRHWLPDAVIGQDTTYQCEIATAGNQHSWRVAFYKHLAEYKVKLWGNPAPLWMPTGPVAAMFQGRGVYNHDKVRAFRGAKIVVNNLHYSEIWGVNARCFEVAGAGAFQMMDWRPGLAHLFEDGRELITFRGIADLKQKIDHWLPRDAERRAIAAAGMRRAHAEHTYAIRLNLLLDTLAGSQRGFSVPEI